MYQTAIGTHQMRTSHRNPHTPELPTPYEVVLPHYVKCFPEYLRAAGYYCTNNDKTDYQFTPPVTAWDECSKAAHWRNRPDPSQPFFAVFNETFTHESGMWPKDAERVETDPARVTLPPYLPDTPACRLALARHYDNLARAKAQLHATSPGGKWCSMNVVMAMSTEASSQSARSRASPRLTSTRRPSTSKRRRRSSPTRPGICRRTCRTCRSVASSRRPTRARSV